ncbi:Miff domain-containing protein [Caenorhabditis elegans]|uniref:Miff domain-containing protein n=1 Tax=Caenorhabditis elegans TaxID=6239 RepID=Q18710_CAEEL|nr:Miff domain-containing protein [Caenorhabditis elegans]CAA94124.2 Miff domain-containing protein [Caenorhabditis elegans]
MNSSQRRSIMFGEKAVIEMDIDPFVSNLDTPADLKVPPTYTGPMLSTQLATPTMKKRDQNQNTHRDDEKKENNATEAGEPSAKKRC